MTSRGKTHSEKIFHKLKVKLDAKVAVVYWSLTVGGVGGSFVTIKGSSIYIHIHIFFFFSFLFGELLSTLSGVNKF